MEKDDNCTKPILGIFLERMKFIETRLEYIEELESIKYPDHLKELINDLMDRVDELEFKLANKNYN